MNFLLQHNHILVASESNPLCSATLCLLLGLLGLAALIGTIGTSDLLVSPSLSGVLMIITIVSFLCVSFRDV